jgi:hypothetical protein
MIGVILALSSSRRVALHSLTIGSAEETVALCEVLPRLFVLSFRREVVYRKTALARLKTIC